MLYHPLNMQSMAVCNPLLGGSSSQLSWARRREKSPVRGAFRAHLKAKTLAKGRVNLHLFLSSLGLILGTKLRMMKIVALSASGNYPRPKLAMPKFSNPLVTLPLILDGNFGAFATKSLASSNRTRRRCTPPQPGPERTGVVAQDLTFVYLLSFIASWFI